MAKSRADIQRQYRYRNPNYHKDYNARIRKEVLKHYSNGVMQCACCGEERYEFLCIDHINGGGTKHRRVIGYGGGLWQWLRSHGYPLGYRVLCYNCNFSLGHYGHCPHGIIKEERE